MHCYQIIATEIGVSVNDGPVVSDGKLSYALPDEATDRLSPILDRYSQNPYWYFDKLNFGKPPAPWAIACMDCEYAIAGHVATARRHDSGIGFSPYTQPPDPTPEDFVPAVGVITFMSKQCLENAANKSPLFSQSWMGLKDCSPDKNWLLIHCPLEGVWLDEALNENRERWLAYRNETI